MRQPEAGGPPRRAKAATPLLIHYHIFKNAGTSFTWALKHELGEGFRAFDKPSPKGFVSSRDLKALAHQHPDVFAISSHQAAPPAPKIRGREVLSSILIRDPIARIRSIHSFERRQQVATPGAIKAKELSFREYVEWRLETSPTSLCNFQVYYCTRMEGTRPGAPDRAALEQAIRNLDEISIVGTVARYQEWLALAQDFLGGPFPNLSLPSGRRNVTSETGLTTAATFDQLRDELGDTIVDYLLKNNELDMCLHQVADALLTRRLAERGVALSLLQAYTNAQRGQSSERQLS